MTKKATELTQISITTSLSESSYEIYVDAAPVKYISSLDLSARKIGFVYPSPSRVDEAAISAFKNAGFAVELTVLSDA
jgi:hypothetical protein